MEKNYVGKNKEKREKASETTINKLRKFEERHLAAIIHKSGILEGFFHYDRVIETPHGEIYIEKVN